jgi:hypothetical protein
MKLKIREIIPSVSYANIKDAGFKYPNILLKEFAKYVTLWYSPTKHPVSILIGIPTITSITPSSGSISGGDVITIVGTNFIYLLSVKIGGSSVGGISILDDGEIIINTPAGSIGTVALSVTTESGVATTTFTYI